MGNTEKKPGTKMRVSNPPNKNGNPNGNDWENLGNLFLDPNGRHGTFYLDIPTEQAKKLLKAAADGRVKRKFGIFLAKSKGGAQGSGGDGAPALAAAA